MASLASCLVNVPRKTSLVAQLSKVFAGIRYGADPNGMFGYHGMSLVLSTQCSPPIVSGYLVPHDVSSVTVTVGAHAPSLASMHDVWISPAKQLIVSKPLLFEFVCDSTQLVSSL